LVGHEGHVTAAWQLSLTTPHLFAQVVDVDARVQPHTLAVPALHCWPAPVPHVAVPQLTGVPLQPLGMVPQLVPAGQLVIGVHPQ
jgi:hypothetical protein